jgi:uncharacterized protein (DUF169 family)
MKEIFGLRGSPIGIRIIRKGAKTFSSEPCSSEHMRFCQALLLARHGKRTVICEENLVFPAAARAFGFRTLPEPLENGKGLVGSGITAKEEVGKMMWIRALIDAQPLRLTRMWIYGRAPGNLYGRDYYTLSGTPAELQLRVLRVPGREGYRHG